MLDNNDLPAELADTEPFDPAADKAAKAEQVDAKAAQNALAGSSLAAMLPAALERLHRRANGTDKPIALSWPRLAQGLGGGLWPGCHFLVGATGAQKSQWALQIALEAAMQGVPSRYIGLELDDLGLVARLLTLAAKGSATCCFWSDLYTGRLGLAGKSALDDLADAYGAELARLPFYLDTDQGAGGWPYTGLDPAVAQLRAAYPESKGRPVLVVVDFLQLVGGVDGAREELRERIGKAAYAAREAARKHNAVILVLSSTARQNYGDLQVEIGVDGMPTTAPAGLVGLGKESGEVEFAADSVLALCKAASDPDTVWLAVAKQRAGATGWYRLETERGYFREGGQSAPFGAGGSTVHGGDLQPVPQRGRRTRRK